MRIRHTAANHHIGIHSRYELFPDEDAPPFGGCMGHGIVREP